MSFCTQIRHFNRRFIHSVKKICKHNNNTNIELVNEVHKSINITNFESKKTTAVFKFL